MAGYRGKQGAKPKASTIVERNRRLGHESTLKGIPKPPEHLNDDERKVWRVTAKVLRDNGLLSSADKDLLALYCVEACTYVEANRHVTAKTLVVKADNGVPMRNPWLVARDKSRDAMLKIQGELGMTPAARSRIPKRESEDKTPKRKYQAYKADPRELLEALN